jgi:hypothetical protein
MIEIGEQAQRRGLPKVVVYVRKYIGFCVEREVCRSVCREKCTNMKALVWFVLELLRG